MKRQYKRYFTKEKKDKINPDNIKLYEKYRKSNILKNKEVKDTTYATYDNYFTQFLVFLAEEYENVGLYDEELLMNMVDILEGFMGFCQDTLGNHKKVINTKLSAISSFYVWSVKRKLLDNHPFAGKLDRMKDANSEKIVNSYFLTPEEVRQVTLELEINDSYDIQDQILWSVLMDSVNRIGAIATLTLDKLDLENNMFTDIREKRGYRVEVVFEESCKDLIIEWLEMRKENYDKMECDALFISRYSGKYQQMSKGTLQRRVKKIGEILGIDDFHAHCTRKTAINNITEETGDITLAQELANHRSVATTQQAYIKPKSKTEIKKKIKEARMKNKSLDNLEE